MSCTCGKTGSTTTRRSDSREARVIPAKAGIQLLLNVESELPKTSYLTSVRGERGRSNGGFRSLVRARHGGTKCKHIGYEYSSAPRSDQLSLCLHSCWWLAQRNSSRALRMPQSHRSVI